METLEPKNTVTKIKVWWIGFNIRMAGTEEGISKLKDETIETQLKRERK